MVFRLHDLPRIPQWMVYTCWICLKNNGRDDAKTRPNRVFVEKHPWHCLTLNLVLPWTFIKLLIQFRFINYHLLPETAINQLCINPIKSEKGIPTNPHFFLFKTPFNCRWISHMGVPLMGVPPVIIHFRLRCSIINHLFWGTLPF